MNPFFFQPFTQKTLEASVSFGCLAAHGPEQASSGELELSSKEAGSCPSFAPGSTGRIGVAELQ
jgi:hypothetical protein